VSNDGPLPGVAAAVALAAIRIRVRGLVQGVGFRPFVYRLAREWGLAGWVCNDADGVSIHLEGAPHCLGRFQAGLRRAAPAAAMVLSVIGTPATPSGYDAFRIVLDPRDDRGCGGTRVPPDRAVCPACLREVMDPRDRRSGYALTTCTECGPRYSLIVRMPYDRDATSMCGFPLCPDCDQEYGDPESRRFHAQPIACHACGPRIALWAGGGVLASVGEAVRCAAAQLRDGRILALKGLGGFQFLVRADQSGAVNRLRERKHRPTKPLAVMAPAVEVAARLGVVGPAERRLLASPENPIVLVAMRPEAKHRIAPEVAPGMNRIGVMLPTTPLHHLLLAELDFVVVATSGNRSDEPIVVDEGDAVRDLSGVADCFLVHDRPIVRRVDDSVVQVVEGRMIVVRMARGYAPLPLAILEKLAGRWPTVPAPILAVGGQQKAALALWTGAQAVLSPHIGDLDSPQSRAAYVHMVREFADLYGCEPAAVACDLHPDYFTTRWAEESGLPLIRVQHHHAHAAACMAEHGLLDEEVLAVTWDGSGYGPDGTVWGGEILRARLQGYERVASLRPFPLLGGEAAIRQPARSALAVLAQALGEEALLADKDLLRRLGLSHATAKALLRAAVRGVNAPWTSSMGRLFDAVAALALSMNDVSYEGEAAIRLEAVVDPDAVGSYALPFGAEDKGVVRADWRPLIREVVADLRRGTPPGVIGARFHRALAEWAAAVAALHPGLPVVLSGGCFQNATLLTGARQTLEAAGRRVYCHGLVPSGDGGLAVGQLAVALATGCGTVSRPCHNSPKG
jgi:hydrogenase maturation protein HypF